jgi:hypothetical protein
MFSALATLVVGTLLEATARENSASDERRKVLSYTASNALPSPPLRPPAAAVVVVAAAVAVAVVRVRAMARAAYGRKAKKKERERERWKKKSPNGLQGGKKNHPTHTKYYLACVECVSIC